MIMGLNVLGSDQAKLLIIQLKLFKFGSKYSLGTDMRSHLNREKDEGQSLNSE